MGRFVYEGAKRREISFPLGGIGTGCLGLDGTGRLRDWEIFGRPNKGSVNGFSHFGVKAERAGEKTVARVMHADLPAPYMGDVLPGARYNGYGFGPSRYLMSGLPHFRNSVFTGQFPFARVDFIDEAFPGKVALDAFNPFVPLDADASGIPAAFFTAEITNTTDADAVYTVELSVNNPASAAHRNDPVCAPGFTGVRLSGAGIAPDDPAYGGIVFGAAQTEDVAVQQYWYRGSWFDNIGVFWQDFCASGALKNRVYDADFDANSSVREDVATVAVRFSLRPGETARKRFVIAWHYPNCVNYWSDDAHVYKGWKHEYASRFADAEAVAAHAVAHWDALESRTRAFRDALYATTMPDEALEALTANLATLKSPTCLRLENGEFYGFEGCHADCGCCEGSCTHVWNYAFALPFLFPRLERSMRELDFTYNQRDDGGMAFRLQLPLGRERSSFRPCVDGQMGGVIKTYREWKVSGDDAWLKKWWPKIKKSLEYAWSDTNYDRWDPDKSGVITGRQHHTLDMELFGPNAWLNGFYIGALKAAAEMARAVGDPDAAQYARMADAGRQYTDAALFNGEYYIQKIDLRDRDQLRPYKECGDAEAVYWSDEAGQVKYQIGDGCGVDQVLAQWMCALSGVGEILDPDHVRSALHAIYAHNFHETMRDHANPCRIYALNDESGLVICEWPEGAEKPVVPIPYAEETMHGFEYQAACHMIMRGMEKEALRVVRGVRDRYDGERRNPWNEFECGSNYARSMASYALLLAYSGFTFDMTKRSMGFAPLHGAGQFFWSLDGAWGTFALDDTRASLRVAEGAQRLAQWILPDASRVASLMLDGAPIPFAVRDGAVCPASEITLRPGQSLDALYK